MDTIPAVKLLDIVKGSKLASSTNFELKYEATELLNNLVPIFIQDIIKSYCTKKDLVKLEIFSELENLSNDQKEYNSLMK